MARNRFIAIMKHMRFDEKSRRRDRLRMDKFCHVSEIWNAFIENCQRCYIPDPNLTIDEQLFPCKSRCPFTQFMASKPDKYGIKFWMLTDSKNSYLFNSIPYLGKEDRPSGTDVPASVCMKLLEPVFDNGYNVTCDSYFTSLNLAEKLKSRRTTLLGTIRKQRREVPDCESVMKNQPVFSTEVFVSDSTTLTAYKAKKSRIVYVLSSMHNTVKVDQQHRKRLPETVKFYNETKAGVDVLDQMARYHTSKTGTRRWPMAVFFNLLDLAAINALIIFKLTTGENISRRKFLLDLIKELCDSHPSDLDAGDMSPELQSPSDSLLRSRRQCQLQTCKNKSSCICMQCKKVCCGQHTATKKQFVWCDDCKQQA